jgi:alpha-beta hydrolase superfamily lysophospholipase
MSDIQQGDGRVTTQDGLVLATRQWVPSDPRAALLFVHGLGEHSGRYDHVARRFAARGFGCHALDIRGHGRSPGLRVHVDRFDEFVGDVAAMRTRLREAHPRLPLVLVGHSQGGLIVLHSALAAPEGLAGVVVSSPFLGIHPSSRPSALVAAAARVLSRLAPRLRLDNGVDPAYLSHDAEVVKAYVGDPLVSTRVSARWFTEILSAHQAARAQAPRLAVPALVMQSGSDHLVDPAVTRDWAAAAPAGLVEYVEWEGLYHEMFNEPEKETVFAHMERWLDQRLAA